MSWSGGAYEIDSLVGASVAGHNVLSQSVGQLPALLEAAHVQDGHAAGLREVEGGRG